MLKSFFQSSFLLLSISASRIFAAPFADVPKTVEMMTQVAMQIPETVRTKMASVISFDAQLRNDQMYYTVQSHYSMGDMWAGTMELSIVEQWRRVGRTSKAYYSVHYKDLGIVQDQMGTEPNQEFISEESAVIDARKMAEVMLQVSPMLDVPTRERVENVVDVIGRAEGSSTVFHMRAHYPAGDFWQGTLELTITETPRRVGRRLINTYEVNANDLGAE